MPRARPLTPDERRSALISATLPLLYEHGRNVTTRLIAEAAGVAEGTIFRVFDTKDDLVDAALARAFQLDEVVRRVAEIDLDQPLEQRLLTLASILHQRFRATFGLQHAMGIFGPPPRLDSGHQAAVEELHQRMVDVVRPDADRLSVPPEHLVHLLRLLTFSGSHPKITEGRLLTPQEVVDTLLHGVLEPGSGPRTTTAPTTTAPSQGD